MTLAPLSVKKRDGHLVLFDREKIENALLSAFKESNPNMWIKDNRIQRVVDVVCHTLQREHQTPYSVQTIQHVVEQSLIELGESVVAKDYTDYRLAHDIERQRQWSIDYQVNRLLDKEDDVVNENANKDADVYSTLRDLKAGAVDRAIGLQKLPPRVRDAHLSGLLHWHDLDFSPATSMHNCGLVNLEDLLKNGFTLGNADVEPPNSIQVAVSQASQILAAISSGQYGGTSYDRIDEVLAPYAKKTYDKHLEDAKTYGILDEESYAKQKTKKDIFNAMQSLEYNINTIFSTQGQTPFTTIGFGLGTDWFSREIQRAILTVRLNGLGKDGRTAIFPKLLMAHQAGVNKYPEDPNYDLKQLALKCVTRRMSPEILNVDHIKRITGSFKSAMGCRSFLNGLTPEDLKGLGVEEDFSSGRLNIGVVSLNLPRVALDSNGDQRQFWALLDDRLSLVKEALLFRLDQVKQALPKQNPIGFMSGGYGRLSATDDVSELLFNNRASISLGYVGLYEMAAVFYGDWQKDHTYDEEARDFAYNVLKYLNETAAKWKKEYNVSFSVYGTPGESLNSRFEEMDHKLYPNVPYVTDHDFYTNSFHYFVERQPTPFEKLAFEAPFQALSTGGFISYVELPMLTDNLSAVEALWNYSDDVGIGYFEINTAIDHCLECGFRGEYVGDEKGYHCPNCGNDNPETSDVTRRTCGYLGNPMKRPMKRGRQMEIIHRVKHTEGSLGKLSDGRHIWSSDEDEKKIRN